MQAMPTNGGRSTGSMRDGGHGAMGYRRAMISRLGDIEATIADGNAQQHVREPIDLLIHNLGG